MATLIENESDTYDKFAYYGDEMMLSPKYSTSQLKAL